MTARRLALAVLLVAAVGPSLPGAAAEGTGALQVTCWPGHRVFLDDQAVGTTSSDQDGLWLPEVAAGERTVRVERDGFLPRTYRVEVPEGGIAELRVEALEPASGSVRVVCAPGHRVYLEGRLVGLTDQASGGLVLAGLEPGRYRLRVEKLGFEPLETAVDVVGGQELELRVEGLAAAGGAGPGAAAPAAVTTRVVVAPEPAPPDAAAASPGVVLRREQPQVENVLFGYRAAGLPAGASVAVHRERGGPRSPVLVFWCVEKGECLEQTRAGFPPGAYRFRVTCRQDGVSIDRFLELDARSGSSYLVDVTFDGGAELCSAELREVPAE